MADRLLPADPDTVVLADTIQEKFLDLTTRYERKYGVSLPIPPTVQRMMVEWRTMLLRFRKRDYRRTDSELKGTREFAQWTVDEHMKLQNQPAKKINWSEP